MQPREDVPGLGREGRGRNPLTGLNPLQPEPEGPLGGGVRRGVAIPLRGSIPCNAIGVALPVIAYESQSPYGAQSLATVPPKEPRPGRRRQRGGL